MKREAWMSEEGYRSGVVAERKLKAMLRKQEAMERRMEAAVDEWWTSMMAGWVGLALLAGLLYGVGMASAHAGMLDYVGIDSKLAVQQNAVGWRVWFGGALALSAVTVVVMVLRSAVLRMRLDAAANGAAPESR